MSKNTNLHSAKSAKNDEFYTQISDIEKELVHYKQHFKDKVVLCNCDDPTQSAFWKYFHLNFAYLGLKKLIATHYEHSQFKFKNLMVHSYVATYCGGFDEDITVCEKQPLRGDGDFRSPECIKLLDECDIVCTNPPFSLFREFIETIYAHGKQFLVIGSKNAITYKNVFRLIKDNKLWLGCCTVSEFLQPDGNIKKFGNIGWYTNLTNKKRRERLILWKHYTPEEYPKYDNYDAINVDKVADIPCDYDGIMGVPITFLDKYNPEQFQIIDINPHFFMCPSARIGQLTLQGAGRKDPYARLLIKFNK